MSRLEYLKQTLPTVLALLVAWGFLFTIPDYTLIIVNSMLTLVYLIPIIHPSDKLRKNIYDKK